MQTKIQTDSHYYTLRSKKIAHLFVLQ